MTLQTGRDGFEFKRNDIRNDSIRKRRKRQEGVEKDMKRKDCLHTGCPKIGQRGWAKGFCCVHAHLHNLINPRKEKHHKKLPVKKAKKLKKLKKLNSKKLKVKDVMMKPKLKLKAKPKLKLKKAEAARVAARAAMESDSEPDVFPFPPRAEDAELFCRMHDEELAKWQSDPDADIFQYPLRAQDKQMLSKLIFLDSKTKAKAKKEEKPRSQVLRSTFEKESQAALKLINSKKLKKRQNKETKLKRKDIEAMDIEFKLMEPLAAVDAELAESDAEFQPWSDEITLHKPVQGYAPAAASDDVLAESDAEFRSWSDEPQRRSSEEAAAKRQEDEEIWRLKQESRLMGRSEEAAVRSREDMEILGLKREAVVRRREDEISVHKATLRRARLGTARNRLEFDDVDFCWPSPPRGRLVWDED